MSPIRAGFADLLADGTHSRVLLPTHPGFTGTSRSTQLQTTRDLAAAYVDLLDHDDLTGVTVIGNSFGGWIAAEIALLASPRVGKVVIVDGIGPDIPAHPMTDVRGLEPAELARLSWHDPSKAPVPPAASDPGTSVDPGPGPSPDILALIGYTGPTMSDPTLLGRLADIDVPVQVVWGESDRIVNSDYGRTYAAAIPSSTFTLLPHAGHLPQMEAPEELLRLIEGPPALAPLSPQRTV